MATSAVYKKLYEKYQTEAAPNGMSIVGFCQINGMINCQ